MKGQQQMKSDNADKHLCNVQNTQDKILVYVAIWDMEESINFQVIRLFFL